MVVLIESGGALTRVSMLPATVQIPILGTRCLNQDGPPIHDRMYCSYWESNNLSARKRINAPYRAQIKFVAMLDCQRHLFDIPDDVAYLNCAYISPLLNAVRDAGIAGTQRKSHPWEIFPRDFFTDAEEARGLFAELIGATANDVALGSAASYGTATAARNLPVQPGQRILVLQDQFPSNVYSWHALANESDGTILTLQRPQDDDWTRSVLEALDERVAIAALPHVHWTDGAMLDLVRIGARCREGRCCAGY
ncbi:MAG: hypothetical protein CM1200mP18_14720 [Gammaproteobacteria bacterium]|nr:MAG: hypothetical protein CM1200mP18_14720 [Gammaproteobacteria bacterium]